MAQLKIVWSKEAQDNFLQFRYPYMYPATSVQETRAFVCEYFKVFYSVYDRYILVESVFDTRQNPSKLPY